MLRAALFLLSLAVVSCASPPPPELSTYTAAFDQSREATTELLRVFEPAEKAVRAPSDTAVFDPDDAPYIVREGRGGVSLLIARGFDLVGEYNAILTRYAGGESIDTLKPAVDRFSRTSLLLAGSLGLTGVGTAAAAVVEGVQTLGAALLTVSDRAEFARLVAERSGTVDAFLAHLRAMTPDMYRTVTTHVIQRQVALGQQGRVDEVAALGNDLATFRELLASWVLTIDNTRAAIAALEGAVAAQQAGAPSLDEVAFWMGEVARHAEAVKFSARNISRAFNP